MEGKEPSTEGMGGPSPQPAEDPLGLSPLPFQEPSGPSPQLAQEPSGSAPPLAQEPSGSAPPLAQEPSGSAPQLAQEPSGSAPPLAQEPSGPSPQLVQEPSGPPPLPAEAPWGAVVGEDKQEEEEEEEEVEVSDTHTQTKRKPPGGYTARPIVPARRAELLAVAKAMHREHFGWDVQELFHLETEAALKAMQTGLYIGWRCPEYLWDCFRVGDLSRCFCGHLLQEHQTRAWMPCTVASCRCQSFLFIPSRPEDVGEFWLRKRVGFDPSSWRATCRCKHSHEEHPCPPLPCPGCWCVSFESSFLCAACDRRWEEHETFFETAEMRRKGGRPYGM
uniref:Family with sequence similarity 221 member B n=1 Tax=Pelusios castaneus TaxID=367368 RepID=A0A8C8RNW3_9SAUR